MEFIRYTHYSSILVLHWIFIIAQTEAFVIQSEYLTQVCRKIVHARLSRRPRMLRSAVMIMHPCHSDHLIIVSPQYGIALELISGSTVPQHPRLVPVRVMRTVHVAVQRQFRVTSVCVYDFHCNMVILLVY